MISGLKKRSCCDICGGKKETWQDFCSKCRLDLKSQVDRIESQIRVSRKIYAISVAGDPLANVKFGFSADPLKRMADMQVGCPVLLELLAACDGTHNVELAIHQFLIDSWHHGEWFSRTEKVDAVVMAMRDGKVKSHIGMHSPDVPVLTELKRQLGVSS
jgi:hypothetical protein